MMRCDIVVVPETMLPVYVEEGGVLEECFVSPLDEVVKGQPLARLRNRQLESLILEAEGSVAVKQAQLRFARDETLKGIGVSRVGALQAEVDEAISLLAALRIRSGKLTIQSPIAGTIMETPYRHPAQVVDEDILVDQQPFLIQKYDNVSAAPGQRFCEVADLDKWRGIVLLSEQQVGFVESGQEARIRLHSRSNETIVAKIAQDVGITDLSINRKKYELSLIHISEPTRPY